MPDLKAFSIHPLIRNKPALWQPEFASGWQGREAPLEALQVHVSSGGAFIPAALVSDHRNSAAFAHADLAVVDIDNGLTIAQFGDHPLGAHAAWVYTTASHNPAVGQERFRVVFQLPRRIDDSELYKAVVTILSRSLGGDKSCTDPCRLFYGNDNAEHPLWQPKALLPESILEDAAHDVTQSRVRFDRATQYYEDLTIQQAIFVLEQVIEPTSDGERDRFVKVTAAASSAGEAIFPAWSDWASRGHHGKGKNSRQAGEKFFRGFHGRSTLATLFYLANEDRPNWRDDLPPELRSGPSLVPAIGKSVGYDHESFLGLDDPEYLNGSPRQSHTPSLFDDERPWLTIAKPEPAPTPVKPQPGDHDDEPEDEGEPFEEEFDDYMFGEPIDPPQQTPIPKRRGGSAADNDTVERIKDRLERLYPGMRLNVMSLALEYGSREKPIRIPDISTAYVRISRGAGTVFSKTLVYDTAQVMGFEHKYHPVCTYLENCAASVPACPYFKTLATELLGLSDDPTLNPTFEDGRTFADVIMERFLIGAVDRAFNPGCDHDWMPILVGSQNCGKSTFFRYLTPPDPSDPGTYPWVATIQQGIGMIKDRPHTLHAGWIVVFDEAERYFKRRYVEEFKNLISVSVDRSARKYENERDFQRGFVLCGATNSNDFLVDPTGNRRFMPITVQGKIPSSLRRKTLVIDLDRLKADRDAIWSAAYQAYLDNPVHTWSSHELSVMKDYLDGYSTDTPLLDKVARLLEIRRTGVWREFSYVTLSDVFDWLEIPVASQHSMAMAVTDAMKRLGWSLKIVKIGGKNTRIWIHK